MKFVIDTEFNGFGGQLISMGLVAEDGTEFYEELVLPKVIDPWVKQHVVPHLTEIPVPMSKFQAILGNFLGCFDNVHLIADWPEDIKHFCDCLVTGPGKRMALPGAKLDFTVFFGLPSTSQLSKIPHHALEDARAIARALGWSPTHYP